jgi:hypothetical protein
MLSTILFRLIHIICGVMWVGGIGVIAMFVMPSVAATGPAGGQFMQHVVKNTRLTTYLPALGVVTVLSGFGLFWRNTSISSGAFASSRPGMTYSLGAVFAIAARASPPRAARRPASSRRESRCCRGAFSLALA